MLMVLLDVKYLSEDGVWGARQDLHSSAARKGSG